MTRDVCAPSAKWSLQGVLPLSLGDSLVPHAGDKRRTGAGVRNQRGDGRSTLASRRCVGEGKPLARRNGR
jgi:hypothetical protein